jgi:hypothetical protein
MDLTMTDDGKVVLDDEAIRYAITLSSQDGEVSPLAPGLGPCLNWKRKIEPNSENRGYAMMRDPLDGRMRYVHKIVHRVFGGSDETKWRVNPVCRSKRCISPEHWRKD